MQEIGGFPSGCLAGLWLAGGRLVIGRLAIRWAGEVRRAMSTRMCKVQQFPRTFRVSSTTDPR